MDKKKIDIAALTVGAGKTATDMLGKAKNKVVQVMDQNDDGKLDLKDASEIAGAVGNAVKKTAASVKESASEKAKALEERALQPIFEQDIDGAEFVLTKLIRLCEKDKKRTESDVCQGAIGHFTEQKELKVVNIYNEFVGKFDISFYPDNTYEFYYVDPSDRDRYIALDEYFSYLKIEKINELQKLAQDLGAKHFRVTYKEEKTIFSEKSARGTAKVGAKNGADASMKSSESNYSTVEIAAEMDCPGHPPIMPTLRYLQKDPSIQNLIAMRMDERAPLTHQKFLLKLSNSSGIKENDAIKIDAVLKGMKCAGNATVTNEAKNESRRYLEYEIDF